MKHCLKSQYFSLAPKLHPQIFEGSMDWHQSPTLTANGTFGTGAFSAHLGSSFQEAQAGSGGIWGNPKQELRTCWVPREWGWPSLAKISVNLRNNRKGGLVTVCTLSFQEVRPQHRWYWCEWLAEPAGTGRSQSSDNNCSYSQGALQGLCASCGALIQRLLFCLDTEMTQGHSRQEQERSDDVSDSLTALMNGYNGTQSKQGGQLPQRRCWRVSPCTSERNCPPSQLGCPALATRAVKTMCSQMTCHQKLLEVSGLHFTQQ